MNIKLRYVVAALIFINIGSANAQLKMESGKTDIALKIGSPFLRTSKFNDIVGEDFKATTPAFGFTFETGLFKNVSVGADISYAKFKNDVTYTQSGPAGTVAHVYGTMSIAYVALYAKYFTPLRFPKLATYIRADFLPLGAYAKNRTTDFSTGVQTFSNDSGVKTIYGIYAAANYQLAGHLSAFGEIGYGYTAVNVGISLRIGDN